MFVAKESYAIYMFVIFSTVVECMPFFCLYFPGALPPGLTKSKEVLSIHFHLMCEFFHFPAWLSVLTFHVAIVV